VRPTSRFDILVILLLLAVPTAIARGDEATLTGRQIMDLVDARDDGDNSTQDMTMILIDKNGNQRERTIHAMSRDVGEDTHTIMFFLSPADVKDTGFLTYDYDDESADDDQWLYLPALKKTKRIASSDKSGSFMGSDFSYADMTDRKLDNYEYRLMEETDVDGVPVWQVESIPITEKEIDETGYTKSIVFVRKDNYVVIRAVSWVKKGNRLKYLDVKKLEKIDGIWVPTEMHMTTKKGKKTLHKTVITSDNVRFNQELDEDLFTVRTLEKGL
jgi:outer membrane lipoprotein-sorting protein